MSNFTVKMSIYGLFPALFLLQCVFVRVLFSCTPFFLATLSLARLGTLLTNGSCVWGFFGPLVWALRPKGGFLGHNNEFLDEGGGGFCQDPGSSVSVRLSMETRGLRAWGAAICLASYEIGASEQSPRHSPSQKSLFGSPRRHPVGKKGFEQTPPVIWSYFLDNARETHAAPSVPSARSGPAIFAPKSRQDSLIHVFLVPGTGSHPPLAGSGMCMRCSLVGSGDIGNWIWQGCSVVICELNALFKWVPAVVLVWLTTWLKWSFHARLCLIFRLIFLLVF